MRRLCLIARHVFPGFENEARSIRAFPRAYIIAKTSLHEAWLEPCITLIHLISYEIQFELHSRPTLAAIAITRCNVGTLRVIDQSVTL